RAYFNNKIIFIPPKYIEKLLENKKLKIQHILRCYQSLVGSPENMFSKCSIIWADPPSMPHVTIMRYLSPSGIESRLSLSYTAKTYLPLPTVGSKVLRIFQAFAA